MKIILWSIFEKIFRQNKKIQFPIPQKLDYRKNSY